jgi:hypothetical protein
MKYDLFNLPKYLEARGKLKNDIYVYDGHDPRKLDYGQYRKRKVLDLYIHTLYHEKDDVFRLQRTGHDSYEWIPRSTRGNDSYIHSNIKDPIGWAKEYLYDIELIYTWPFGLSTYHIYQKKLSVEDHTNFNDLLKSYKRERKQKELRLIKEQQELARKKEIIALNNRILKAQRDRVYYALKNSSKNKSTLNLLGVSSMDDVRTHLESLFREGMSWDNYGRKKGVKCWVIDHIVPCAAFDFSDPKQQEKCFHYTNLQPLWEHENLAKSSKHNNINHSSRYDKK